jgi:hypothetical protein
MSTYIAIKRAKFAGVDYMPGDTVPAEAIPANRIGAVIRMGIIAEQAGSAPAAPAENEEPKEITFTVPIIFDNGDVEQLPVTPATVEEAVSVLQMTADGATEHIADMTDDAALVLIDACDNRKTVKAAAAARAKALEEAAKAGGNDPGQAEDGAAQSGE